MAFARAILKQPVSSGQVTIETSRDPVGAPIFYRDVPLMPNQGAKGVIRPLAPEAIGLIKWRLRYLDEPSSRVVMEKISTCANCHSFSADGKTLGLDVDGPPNDHGLYALIPVAKQTVDSHPGCDQMAHRPRSQDPAAEGRFHVAGLAGRPLRGVDHRRSRRCQARRRAHAAKTSITSPISWITGSCRCFIRRAEFWAGTIVKPSVCSRCRAPTTRAISRPAVSGARDAKYIVFERAEAETPYPPGVKMATYANDPNETQIKYDLYRIPVQRRKGRHAGAHFRAPPQNGMSNSFPKVSPDGRWIVYVQCRNGMVQRPDSKLYIVPFKGGQPRLMKCNTRLMNSWHTFSPNGRWLAFSSKSRSPYTQLYLTHIDADGNDTPAILVDNTTAANRAVNLPEFANIPKGGLEKIDPQANQYYKMENGAIELMTKNQFGDAAAIWRKALALDPKDGRAHLNLAYCLSQTGEPREALVEFRKACDLSPDDPIAFADFALALAQSGQPAEAVSYYRKSLAMDAFNAGVHADLGALLAQNGQTAEGLQHLEKAVALKPESAAVHAKFAGVLSATGKTAEATAQFEEAVKLAPDAVEFRYDYASALGQAGRFSDAIPQLQKAVDLSGGREVRCYGMLGDFYSKMGRTDDAVDAWRRALELAEASHNEDQVRSLRSKLACHEPPNGASR